MKRKVKHEGERRIYVLVAEKIVTSEKGLVIQPPGRQIAQAAHVVSKLRHDMVCRDPDTPWYAITTIILQARDAYEMWHVASLLDRVGHTVTSFWDRNDEAYGSGTFCTAICTEPVFKDEVEGILDYLPLWGSQ